MDNFGCDEPYDARNLVEGYDWNAIGKGTVVDDGGSTGHGSIAIAKQAPKLKFVVQDLEKVIGVKERKGREGTHAVEYMVHENFRAQPVKAAEVYLLPFHLP